MENNNDIRRRRRRRDGVFDGDGVMI